MSDMDKGEYVKAEITITPAMNGSYLVRRNWYGDKDGGAYRLNPVAEMMCFSNYRDMLKFLNADYETAHGSANKDEDYASIMQKIMK